MGSHPATPLGKTTVLKTKNRSGREMHRIAYPLLENRMFRSKYFLENCQRMCTLWEINRETIRIKETRTVPRESIRRILLGIYRTYYREHFKFYPHNHDSRAT